jgi:hypothetical protein
MTGPSASVAWPAQPATSRAIATSATVRGRSFLTTTATFLRNDPHGRELSNPIGPRLSTVMGCQLSAPLRRACPRSWVPGAKKDPVLCHAREARRPPCLRFQLVRLTLVNLPLLCPFIQRRPLNPRVDFQNDVRVWIPEPLHETLLPRPLLICGCLRSWGSTHLGKVGQDSRWANSGPECPNSSKPPCPSPHASGGWQVHLGRLARAEGARGNRPEPCTYGSCRRGDLNPHPALAGLGPQPSASTRFRHSDAASSIRVASGVPLTEAATPTRSTADPPRWGLPPGPRPRPATPS